MTTSASYYGEFDSDSQPTLNTVQDYITSARVLLQDTLSTNQRYDDPSLLVAINVALLEARRLRPDLFVYNHRYRGQAQAFTEIDDTYVDIEPQFRLGILYGLCASAFMRDQEDYSADQASSYWAFFNTVLTGKGMPRMAPPAGPGRP
jgi:hypothetical protein